MTVYAHGLSVWLLSPGLRSLGSALSHSLRDRHYQFFMTRSLALNDLYDIRKQTLGSV